MVRYGGGGDGDGRRWERGEGRGSWRARVGILRRRLSGMIAIPEPGCGRLARGEGRTRRDGHDGVTRRYTALLTTMALRTRQTGWRRRRLVFPTTRWRYGVSTCFYYVMCSPDGMATMATCVPSMRWRTMPRRQRDEPERKGNAKESSRTSERRTCENHPCRAAGLKLRSPEDTHTRTTHAHLTHPPTQHILHTSTPA